MAGRLHRGRHPHADAGHCDRGQAGQLLRDDRRRHRLLLRPHELGHIDLIVARDDLDLAINNSLADLLKSEDIVPLDEPERLGANIEATIRSKAYVVPGTVVVDVPSYAEIPLNDRSNRNVPSITFSAVVRQGINTATVTGSLTL